MFSSKPVIFVVISVLGVALIYSSTTFEASAQVDDLDDYVDCGGADEDGWILCCAYDPDSQTSICDECREGSPGDWECRDVPIDSIPTSDNTVLPGDTGVFEDPTLPTPPIRTPGQGGLPQDGVLEQPPTQGAAPPPPTRGQGVLPQDEGVLQQPTDEGAAPRIVEPPPPTCAPGSVLDPDINECVLENPPELCPDGSIPQSTGPGGTQPECPSSEAEQPGAGPVAEEEQGESAPEEEQQQSEEGDGSSSSEDNSDNNDN